MIAKTRRGHAVGRVIGGFFVVIILLFAASPTQAAIRHVNPNNIACPGANGPLVYCSIDAAVNASAAGDVIYIAPGIYVESLVFDQIAANRGLTLIGSGISQTIINSSTRAFLIREDLTIQHMTIQGAGATRSGMGGSVYVNGNIVVNISDVVIRDVEINNIHAGVGGGIAVLAGTVNLLRVAVLNNTAEIESTSNNSTQPSSGGGIFVDQNATLIAVDSVISGNSVNVGVGLPERNQDGGGFGAGIYNLGTTTLINTTVSGNTANAVVDPASLPGGGITNGNSAISAVLNLYNSTVTNNNSILAGGGVYNFNGSVNVRNSIIAGNTGAAGAPDCSANSGNPFTSQGYNIIGNSTGCDQTVFPVAAGDSINVSSTPLSLLALPSDSAAFDDIPLYILHALRTGSIAIDHVGTSNCLDENNAPLNRDQRGVSRPFDGDGNSVAACDAGAYEFNQGVVIYPTSLVTFEDQGRSKLYVALAAPPTQTVQVSLSSRDTSEGSFAANSVSFSTTDWNTPKLVQLDVQNDGISDGDQSYLIDVTVTGINVPPKTISVTNIDTVTPPGLIILPTSIDISEGGSSATVNVRLAIPPAAGSVVNLDIGRDLPNGTDLQEDITPMTLQFDSSNWNTNRSFTVAPRDDTVPDGDISYNLVVSVDPNTTDPAYLSLADTLIPIIVRDNDQPSANAGITIEGATNLVTTESGGQASFTVRLNSAPGADVTVNFVSNSINEGMILSGQNPLQSLEFTFTPQNWDQPQTVTVIGIDDIYADGGRLFSIRVETTSNDIGYNQLSIPPLQVTNNDNDLPGIALTSVGALVTDESGTQATFNVRLTTPPVPNTQVQLSVESQPPNSGLPLEGITNLPASQLIFNSNNYDQPQTVTVTGLDDCLADGDQTYAIIVTTSNIGTTSAPYLNSRPQQTTNVTNRDNDSANTPQIIVSKTQLRTSENLTSDSFYVCLTTQPSAQVTITMDIPSDAQDEGAFPSNQTTQQIVFNQSNWSTLQLVTIAGLDDNIDDGDQTYQLDIAPAISSDPNYTNRTAPSVFVTNVDNDNPNQQNPSPPGIVITSQAELFITSEDGTTTNFHISLATAPTATVTVRLTIPNESSDEGVFQNSDTGQPLRKTLTFTPSNWFDPQQVIVRGVDDSAIETNNASYGIIVTVESTDTQYSNLNVPPINIINVDNDNKKPNNPDSGGGGGINPAWLCLLLGFVWIRYRCRQRFVRC